MRFATARTPNGARVVVQDADGTFLLAEQSISAAALAGQLVPGADRAGVRVDDVDGLDLAPAVTDPGKIVCVGHNYRNHILELGHDLPAHPNLFTKFTEALVGPADDIELDGSAEDWDWEAELAVVIGRPVRRADATRAKTAIAGYTVANDVTARDWQRRTSQFLAGKTFEATTPLGPWIVTPDEIDPADGLAITCTVDGVEKQRASTADLLFSSVELVAYLSQIVTLQPGDVILTGTPGGVGIAMDPLERLRAGSIVVTTIEGIGECRNRCVTGLPATSSAA